MLPNAAGNALAEELMRRLNRELCWRVKWSEEGPPAPAAAPGPAPQAEQAGAGHDGDGDSSQEGEHDASSSNGAGSGNGASANGTSSSNGAPSSSNGAPSSAYRKDANDVLMLDGPEALVRCIAAAEPSPIVGLYRMKSYMEEIIAQYHNVSGGCGGQGVIATTPQRE